jgi:hypothetical protein
MQTGGIMRQLIGTAAAIAAVLVFFYGMGWIG